MSDLEAIRERHQPVESTDGQVDRWTHIRAWSDARRRCADDGRLWPCDTAKVQKVLDRALDPRVLGMAMEKAGDTVIVGAPSFAERVATELRRSLDGLDENRGRGLWMDSPPAGMVRPE